MWKRLQPAFWGLIALSLPVAASAHEVYVLTPAEIKVGLATPPFSWADVIMANLQSFAFWAFIGITIVCIVFFTSISRRLERRFDPFLIKAKHYAPLAARVTAGLAFLMCAYHGALFGPELPLASIFGTYAGTARILLALVGILVLAGMWVRSAAAIAAGLFAAGFMHYGWYMLTYTNYFGEVIVLLLLGAHRVSVERTHSIKDVFDRFFKRLNERYGRYAIPLLRVAFGTSLLYASLYAKFFHNDLALQVASIPLAGHMQSLAMNLGFEPHFLVLGAGIVEIVIALFFMLGVEIRFTALFLEFWLTLSLLYFGEVVWPHLILIGIPISFILYGYDQYSLEGRFFKKGSKEPVL